MWQPEWEENLGRMDNMYIYGHSPETITVLFAFSYTPVQRKDIPIWMKSSKEYQGERRKPSSVINAKK